MDLVNRLKQVAGQVAEHVTESAQVAARVVAEKLGGGDAEPSDTAADGDVRAVERDLPAESQSMTVAPLVGVDQVGHAAAEVSPPCTVVGLFRRTSDAEIALNNLDEADFAPESISVLTNDPAQTRIITEIDGPLSRLPTEQLLAALSGMGLSDSVAERYRAGIAAGAICVAIAAPAGSEDAAAEMLGDQRAVFVRILRSGAEPA